jgi:hypothetical protein
MLEHLLPFVSPSAMASLTALFQSVPPGLWWFLDTMRLDIGIPVVFSAYVARFVIRRLPVIG